MCLNIMQHPECFEGFELGHVFGFHVCCVMMGHSAWSDGSCLDILVLVS